MKRSKFLNMRLPERGAREGEANDSADIEDLTYDIEIIDTTLEKHDTESQRLEREKVSESDFNIHATQNLEQHNEIKKNLSDHKTAATLDHPDKSVTDAKIGTRKIGTTTGLLQALFNAIESVIKSITGETIWNATPKTTLAAAKAHIDNKNNPHGVTKLQVGLGNADNTSDINKPVSTAQAAAIKVIQDDINAHELNKSNPHGVTPPQIGAYTKAEVDNKFSTLESNVDWKEAVNTFADIATTYPNPQDGWTVNVKDTDYTYRYNGRAWVAISANAIPKATRALDGLMPKEKVIEVEANTSAKHTHSNKTLLDTYKQTEANISSAVTQRHSHENKTSLDGITNTLIDSWNAVSKKLSLAGGVLTGFLTLHAKPINDMHAVNKKYVDDIISDVGGGDMLKSVYDSDNDGVVDNAEKLGGNLPSYYEPAFAKNNAFNKNFGTAAGTICQGSDSRLSDARPASGGDATTATKLKTARTINGVFFDGTANITVADSTKEPKFTKNSAFNKNFGTAAGTVCQGNDSRLSDARPASGGTADNSTKLNGQVASYYGKAPKTYTATIGTVWSTAAPYTQTISVSGITAADAPIVDVVLSATAATALSQIEAWGHVGKITTAANSITITCYEEKPTIAIPIQLKVVR